jgi:hypothetical protein
VSFPKLERPFVAALALVLVTGCGPFGYLSKVAKDASRAVADAERAEAPKYAPYEYWGAVTYLEQSKALMAYSEYDRSFDYGDRAKQLAEEAKKKAAMREAGKMRETLQDKQLEDEKKAASPAAPPPKPSTTEPAAPAAAPAKPAATASPATTDSVGGGDR